MCSTNEPTHVIDPDGEVIILLEKADEPFAVWHEEKVELPILSVDPFELADTFILDQFIEGHIDASSNDQKKNTIDEISRNTTLNTDQDVKEKEIFRIQVSAKHLILGLPILKKALTGGGWKESVAFSTQRSIEITAHGWDLRAFLIVLKIIHFQHHKVPRKISLDLLAKIAVIVDYYDCHNAVEFFAELWIESLEETFRMKYSRNLILWLWISWVFHSPAKFITATALAMNKSRNTISHLGLPIPKKIVDEMNRRREEAIQNVFLALEERQNKFLTGKRGCRFECRSLSYEALTNQMVFSSLLSPEPVVPFLGLRFENLVDTVKSFKRPTRCKTDSCHGGQPLRWGNSYTDAWLKDFIPGLSIHLYSNRD